MGNFLSKQKEKEKVNKYKLEDVIIKEIYEREKVTKLIDKELEILKNNLNLSLNNFKEKYKHDQSNVYNTIDNIQKTSTKSIVNIEKNIEKIRFNRLNNIEKDINIIKTKINNADNNLKEIKNTLKILNKHVIQNTTKLNI